MTEDEIDNEKKVLMGRGVVREPPREVSVLVIGVGGMVVRRH